MHEIKVRLDKERYDSKPTGSEAAKINSRVGNSNNVEVLNCPASVYEFVQKVGCDGHTFSSTKDMTGSGLYS